jgi:hypothetical protein
VSIRRNNPHMNDEQLTALEQQLLEEIERETGAE